MDIGIPENLFGMQRISIRIFCGVIIYGGKFPQYKLPQKVLFINCLKARSVFSRGIKLIKCQFFSIQAAETFLKDM
jgi:hypothetical protein